MPIASRSLSIVYQIAFSIFLHLFSKRPCEKVSAILDQASAAGRMVYPRPIRIHNEFDTVIEDVPELQISTICSYLPQIPRVLRNFRTTSKRFCSDLRECFQTSLLSRLTRAPHPHLRLAALCSVARIQTARSPVAVTNARAIAAIRERLRQIFSDEEQTTQTQLWLGTAFPHLSLLLQLGGLDALVTATQEFDVHQRRSMLRLMRCSHSLFYFRDGVWNVLGESMNPDLTGALRFLAHKDPDVRSCAAFYLMLTTPRNPFGSNHPSAIRVIQGLALRSEADSSEAVRAAIVLALYEIANGCDTVATDAMAACLRNESEADRANVLECFALRNECDSHGAIVMVEKRPKFVTFTKRMEELLEGYDRGTLWRDPAHVRIYSLMRTNPLELNNSGLRVEYAERLNEPVHGHKRGLVNPGERSYRYTR